MRLYTATRPAALGFIIRNSLLVLLLPAAYAEAQPSYRRTAAIPPVRLSQAELAGIVEGVQKIVTRANSEAPSDAPDRLDLSLSDGQHEISIQLPEHAGQLQRAPGTSTRLSVSFWRKNAPIAQVMIILADYSRSIEVAGTSPEQVDALMAYLETELLSYRTWIGGPLFRWGLYVLLYLVFLQVFVFIMISYSVPEKVGAPLAGVLAPVPVVLLVWLLPFDGWLPGTAIVAGEASLLVRWAPGLTLVGAVLTAIGLFIPVALMLRRRASSATHRTRRSKSARGRKTAVDPPAVT